MHADKRRIGIKIKLHIPVPAPDHVDFDIAVQVMLTIGMIVHTTFLKHLCHDIRADFSTLQKVFLINVISAFVHETSRQQICNYLFLNIFQAHFLLPRVYTSALVMSILAKPGASAQILGCAGISALNRSEALTSPSRRLLGTGFGARWVEMPFPQRHVSGRRIVRPFVHKVKRLKY